MEKKLFDECFYVEQNRNGMWNSIDKTGKGLISSLTEDACVHATRFYLKFRQDNQHLG